MKKVLNVGSLNIDRTYSVREFVKPKETIKALEYEEFCGGKGLNQSVAAVRAGAEVCHAGAVGRDGAMLLDFLMEAGIHTEYIQQLDAVSGHAVIQVDQDGQNNIIVYGGTNACLSREYIDTVLQDFGRGDILLLQNEVSNVRHAVLEGKKRGMTIVLNPSPFNEEINRYPLEQIDYFLLNEIEGQMLAGTTGEEIPEIMKALREQYPHAAFVLTMGEKGAWFFDQKQQIRQEVYKVDTVDTTAAGDTFSGYFIAGIAAGREIKEILREASAASGITVSRKGAAPSIPAMEEVRKMIGQNHSL